MPKWVKLRYQPDLDCSWEVAPGALTLCDGFVPTRNGSLATWKCETAIASYTSTTEPIASGIVRKNDGTARFFIFNKQSIYEYTSTTAATDRSSATYSASTVGWDWAQFGDSTIAVNLYDAPQASSSGAFANLSGSPPKAQCIAVCLGQVMLGNYNDGTAYPAGWYCSDYDDATDWTVTATNGADNGNLYDTPGPIRSLVTLRDTIVAYKDDSIYVGEFVGDPNTTIWAWRLVSDRVGCGALHGVGVLNDAHYFFHRTGFYVFDGAAVRRLPSGSANTLIDYLVGIGGINNTSSQTTVDQRDNLVLFCMAIQGSVKPEYVVVYNAETGDWSTIQQDVFSNSSSTTDYPTATVKATYADCIAFDSGLVNDDFTTSIFIGPNGAGKIAAQYGVYPGDATSDAASSIQTGWIGNGDDNLTINRIKPRMIESATTGTPTCTVYANKAENTTGADSVAFTWNSTERCFDGHISGRYLYIVISFVGAVVELSGLSIFPPVPAGKR